MKLLLTSAGIKNDSIRAALVEMLGKPIDQAAALLIPTAGYGITVTVHYTFTVAISN